MDFSAHIASLRDEVAPLRSLAPGELGAPVAACPGWTVADVLVHLGRVHRWADANLHAAPAGGLAPFPPRPGRGIDLPAWVGDGLEALIERLDGMAAGTLTPTFGPVRTAAFWARRQAHETALHRWDVLTAAGHRTRLGAALAVDGVDEWCELEAFRWYGRTDAPTPIGTVHLHATDGDGEWFLEVDGPSFQWRHAHEKGDVAARGSREQILLAVWGRLALDELEVFGDSALLRAVLTAGAV